MKIYKLIDGTYETETYFKNEKTALKEMRKLEKLYRSKFLQSYFYLSVKEIKVNTK